jgi:hypothetical protein
MHQCSEWKIPANTPVLINGNGTFTFTGSGSVSTPKAIVSNQFNADYSTIKAYTGGYVLKTVGGVTGFYKISREARLLRRLAHIFLKKMLILLHFCHWSLKHLRLRIYLIPNCSFIQILLKTRFLLIGNRPMQLIRLLMLKEA